MHCNVLLLLVVHDLHARRVFWIGEVDTCFETSEREEFVYGFCVPSQGCSPEPVLVGVANPILEKTNVDPYQ